MRTLGKFILLEPIAAKEVSMFQTGDEAERHAYQQGVVTSIPDSVSKEHKINIGDRILYNRHAGHEQRLNDKMMFILDEKGLVLILEDGDSI